MNKKIHIIISVLLLLFFSWICIKNIKEPFGNQIINLKDDSFDPSELVPSISVLTYDINMGSGYRQLAPCSDDNSWTKGNMTCRDYSLVGSNCDDIGDDGRLAFDACKVACDNCLKYEEIKLRVDEYDDNDSEFSSELFGTIISEDNHITISYSDSDIPVHIEYDLIMSGNYNLQDEGVMDHLKQSILSNLNNNRELARHCGDACLIDHVTIDTPIS